MYQVWREEVCDWSGGGGGGGQLRVVGVEVTEAVNNAASYIPKHMIGLQEDGGIATSWWH